MVAKLFLAINQHHYFEGVSDECRWMFDLFGVFSVSSFSMQISKTIVVDSIDWLARRKAWKNLAPPRAELLMWFILQRCLNTKDRLLKFNYIGSSDSKCLF